MLAKLIRLWEIPNGSLRLVIAAAPQNAASRVLVLELFCPLPHVSYQVHYAKRACTPRVCVNRIRPTHGAALVRHWNRVGIPRVSPRICAPIRALRCILPFPFMRQTLPCPCRVGASILQGHPRHGLVLPTCRIRAVLPVPEEIQIILRMVMSSIEKLLKLRIGHWILVNPE